MAAETRAGRIIGALLIIQMVGGGTVNFSLEAPLFGSPGFLANAAPHSTQIAVGAILGLLIEALWIAIAVTAFPIVFERARSLTLWFFALAAVLLAVAVTEAASVMSMISVSEAYTKANPAAQEQFQAIRVIVSAARNGVHFMARMVDGAALFVFYAILYRLALVPRWLPGLGMIAAVLLIAAIAMPFFGHDVVFPLLAPAGLIELILAAWLLAKGLTAARAG